MKNANDELQAKLQNAGNDVTKVTNDPTIGINLKKMPQDKQSGDKNSTAKLIDDETFKKIITRIQQAEKAIAPQ